MSSPSSVRRPTLLACSFGLLLVSIGTAGTVDFDDLSLAPESVWNGPDPDGTPRPGQFGGTELVGSFRSGQLQFVNRHNIDFGNWSGFAYSNFTDTTTPGFDNQYSAFTGSGLGTGHDNYGVAFGTDDFLDPADVSRLSELPYFELPAAALLRGAYVTNTTFAALSMRDGDAFAKKFGGPTGHDPDWFRLTAYGTDGQSVPLATAVEFYLADYRFSDNSQDYLLEEWTWLDLSPLESAHRIYFHLSSSDVGSFGMNTPAYFGIDGIELASRMAGDFDMDAVVGCHDVDRLVVEIAGATHSPMFDLTGDGLVDVQDLEEWLVVAGEVNLPSGNPYQLGDADLDGLVDVSDFNLWNGSKFHPRPAWCEGDFNADGVVDVQDLNIWNRHKFTSSDQPSTTPEPAGCVLMGIAAGILALRPKRLTGFPG